jgi:hypothetical protein
MECWKRFRSAAFSNTEIMVVADVAKNRGRAAGDPSMSIGFIRAAVAP